MRKVLVILAAGTALAAAAPAAAQYYPQPQYGAPYGNAYGYNNYGQVRQLQARIDGRSLHGVAGLVNLFGIESPGLTSALAIAEHVTAVLDQDRT